MVSLLFLVRFSFETEYDKSLRFFKGGGYLRILSVFVYIT